MSAGLIAFHRFIADLAVIAKAWVLDVAGPAPKGSGVTIDFAAAMPRYTLRRHVSHDLRELCRVMHARIAGMRAQRGSGAELDPLGHPGKRHGGYPGRVGRGLGAN